MLFRSAKSRRKLATTIDDIKVDLARLFSEGSAGTRDTADVARLASVAALLARTIEGADLERRIATLEALKAE